MASRVFIGTMLASAKKRYRVEVMRKTVAAGENYCEN